jgi:hypothetical protein
VLGLTYKQCYGTDEEKNTLTKYRWEDVDVFYRWKFGDRGFVIQHTGDIFKVSEHGLLNLRDKFNYYYYQMNCTPLNLKSGNMTAREVMQIFGTDLIRETFGNIWAEATIRTIKSEGRKLSLITDNRFRNETNTVLQEPCGYVIRLTRNPYGNKDVHQSELDLDKFDWDRTRCFLLDNAKLSKEEQIEKIIPTLEEILLREDPK